MGRSPLLLGLEATRAGRRRAKHQYPLPFTHNPHMLCTRHPYLAPRRPPPVAGGHSHCPTYLATAPASLCLPTHLSAAISWHPHTHGRQHTPLLRNYRFEGASATTVEEDWCLYTASPRCLGCHTDSWNVPAPPPHAAAATSYTPPTRFGRACARRAARCLGLPGPPPAPRLTPRLCCAAFHHGELPAGVVAAGYATVAGRPLRLQRSLPSPGGPHTCTGMEDGMPLGMATTCCSACSHLPTLPHASLYALTPCPTNIRLPVYRDDARDV